MTEAVNMYDEAYEEGYKAALRAIAEANRSQRIARETIERKRKEEKAEKFKYFFMQRSVGASFVAASAVALVLSRGDFIAAALAIPFGLLLMCSKRRFFA